MQEKLSRWYLKHVHAFALFKEATIQGWRYALDNKAEMVDYIYQNYPVNKTRSGLFAEAQASDPYILPAGGEIGELDLAKVLSFLTDMQKLGYLTKEELDGLNLKKLLFDSEQSKFSANEQDYLSRLDALKMDYILQNPPFSYVDSNQQWQGVCRDYAEFIAKSLGLPLLSEAKTKDTWSQSVLAGTMENATVCVPVDRTLNDKLLFTDSIMTLNLALASDQDITFDFKLNRLADKPLGVVANQEILQLLKRSYPYLNVRNFDSLASAFEAMRAREIVGVVSDYDSLNDQILKQGLQKIKLWRDLSLSISMAIGVPRNQPELYRILQKTVQSMSDAEKKRIHNRWLKVEVVQKIDQRRLLEFLWPVVVFITFLIVLLSLLVYQRRQQKRYLNKIYELSKAVYLHPKTLEFMRVSNSFAKMTGYSPEGLRKLKLDDVIHLAKQKTQVLSQVAAGKEWMGEAFGIDANGEEFWVKLQLSPNEMWGFRSDHYLMTCENITDKKRLENWLIRDELTGLYSRRYYNEVVHQEINRAKDEDGTLGFVLMDIDFFKKINDTYGHQHGDQVLIDIANALKSLFHRDRDWVFRIGGEEFLAIVQCESAQELSSLLENIRLDVQDMAIANRESLYGVVTISMGADCIPATELQMINVETIFNRVDDLLYEAKRKGRNRVEMQKRGHKALH